jgi:hypothetical protein
MAKSAWARSGLPRNPSNRSALLAKAHLVDVSRVVIA